MSPCVSIVRNQLLSKGGGKFEKDDCVFQISRHLLKKSKVSLDQCQSVVYIVIPMNFHSMLSVLGLKKYNCNPSASATTILSMANPSPKLPPSVHFPSN